MTNTNFSLFSDPHTTMMVTTTIPSLLVAIVLSLFVARNNVVNGFVTNHGQNFIKQIQRQKHSVLNVFNNSTNNDGASSSSSSPTTRHRRQRSSSVSAVVRIRRHLSSPASSRGLQRSSSSLAVEETTTTPDDTARLFASSKFSKAKTSLATSLRKAVKWTRAAAKRSASIYMDPAARKVGKVLTVSWEPEAAKIIKQKQKEHQKVNSRPFMVGVVGIPGSGKSTSCDILSAYLDDSIVMPMDGYHLPMSVLELMQNSVEMIYRRGAPDTFDPSLLKKDLDRIVHGHEDIVCMPGFDHAKGDPEVDQHRFNRSSHQIVICEGIYLMHDDHGWEDIKSYFDWTIYIDADVDKCIARLKERNKCIPGYTPEEIEIRCDAVDRVNALTVERSRQYATQEVKSCAK